MTYALTIPTELEGVVNVCCAACRQSIGSMRYDTLWAAIRARGPILCPDCRQLHCDYCGLIQTQLTTVCPQYNTFVCDNCLEIETDLQKPKYYRGFIGYVKEVPIKGSVEESSPSEAVSSRSLFGHNSTPGQNKFTGGG